VIAGRWSRRLAILAGRHDVPGAVLGILRVRQGDTDELIEIPYGMLNTATQVPVTADSLFQIGSITKVWTTTVVMQLVDEGRLKLDVPLCGVLSELRLADADVTRQLTMRHLLTHTSGIDGDVFTDTGRGDDCLERYTGQLAGVSQLSPPGATWSYCNSGFVLAGRVIERLCGASWDRVMRDRLFTPLALKHTVTLPEDALLHRVAAGHVAGAGGRLTRAPVWQLPRSIGPAGLITSSAADVLTFARMHLAGGAGPDGRTVLSAAAAAQMAERQVDLPDKHTSGDSWGLGWERATWDGQLVLGHDGTTIGQAAFLQLLPTDGLAVVLLTNGGRADDLYQDLFREIFAELADVTMPSPLQPAPLAHTVTAVRHVGRYERAGCRIEISMRDGRSWLRRTATGPLAELARERSRDAELVAADGSGDLFVIRYPGERRWTPVTFYSVGLGAWYLHQDGRATPMVDSGARTLADPSRANR
jgi:CubicO group peptidase (beta-lactamase class C family)